MARFQESVSTQETVLATLPSQSERERIEIVLCQGPHKATCLQLRQQSWGDGIGWFTQSSVQLEPDQVAALKAALGPAAVRNPSATGTIAAAVSRSRSASKTSRREVPGGILPGGVSPSLRLVRADSA
jgi:hypothetical protein